MRLKYETVERNITKITDKVTGRISYRVRVRRNHNTWSETRDTLKEARKVRDNLEGHSVDASQSRETVEPGIQKIINYCTGRVSYVVRYSSHHLGTFDRLKDAREVRQYAVQRLSNVRNDVDSAIDYVDMLADN